MARWEVEKVAAAHLLEALKVVLDHLRDFTMSGEATDMKTGRNGSAAYAQVRRLRTYVQRCVSAYSELVELDMSDEDQNLLAACAVFEIANLDRKLNGATRVPADQISWLEDRRRVLVRWGTTFATRRIDPIPVAEEGLFLTVTVQQVLREIQRRVVADGQRSGVHRVTREMGGAPNIPGVTAPAATQAAPAVAPDADRPQPALGADGPALPQVAPSTYAPPPEDSRRVGPPAPSREFGIPAPLQGTAPPATPAPVRASSSPTYPTARAAPASTATPASRPGPAAPAEDLAIDGPLGTGLDLDPRKLHDPRVRALLHMDLRGFERALRANDHRLCVVHLGSILEGACIDYALAHRREMALNGAPETWNLEVVVRRAFGDDISSMDRALLFHLNAARNLLRPAIQIGNPIVVTAATQTDLLAFVRRVLTAMGYSGSGEGTPPSGVVRALGPPAPSAGMPPVRPVASAALPGWMRGG